MTRGLLPVHHSGGVNLVRVSTDVWSTRPMYISGNVMWYVTFGSSLELEAVCVNIVKGLPLLLVLSCEITQRL